MSHEHLAASLPAKLPNDPMHRAASWLEDATDANLRRNPNAMVVSTVSANGAPSSRVVLCKSFVADPGYVVFYTNYKSQKSREIESNPRVAVNFHWDARGRQVRMQGLAVKSPADESDRYFATRDWGSQVGAWGSDQSTELASRDALKDQVRARARQFGLELADDLQSHSGSDTPTIPRPPHWGGFRIWPQRIELWIEGADRIHDRAAWTRELVADDNGGFVPGPWSGSRLQP